MTSIKHTLPTLRKIDTLKRRVKSLYKLLRANTLPIRLKLLIFKMVIRPALLYGSPLYRELHKSMLIENLKIVYYARYL